jgi:hypothetical protein
MGTNAARRARAAGASGERRDAGDVRRELSDVGMVVEALGLGEGAKRQPLGFIIRCPAHDDRNPSCSVKRGDDGTIAVKCFTCGFAGDVFHLIAAVEGFTLPRDLPKAIERACELGHVAPAAPRAVPQRLAPAGPPLVDPATFAASAAALLELCPLYSAAVVGLVARGLLFDAQRDGWGELPQARPDIYEGEDRCQLGKKLEALRSKFEPASLRWLLDGRGHPTRGEHRLLIPWRDPAGRVWGMQRRYAPLYGDESPPGGTPKYVWPPSSAYAPGPRHAYGCHRRAVSEPGDLWLVEGAVDVLALRALARMGMLPGVPRRPAVLGLPGVETWPQYRASVLRYVAGRRVLVAFDADKAGDRAVKGGKAMVDDIMRAGALEVVRRRPGAGVKDWGELAALRLGFGKLEWDERHLKRRREREELEADG